jgi:glycosyltransferase involved in cell wall biosynthesis
LLSVAQSQGSPPRALLLLGQSPFDPASGAARSMQTMARWLARAGWAVQSLSTNASEAPHWAAGLSDEFIQSVGIAHWPQPGTCQQAGPLRTLRADGVTWEWLTTTRQYHWESEVGPLYDQRLQALLHAWRPQLVLTFGDDPGDQRRRQWCQAAGAQVVFALHNLAYAPRHIPHVDRFLAPSEFLAQRYRAAWPAKPPIDVLPMPIEGTDLPAAEHEPLSVVYVNPEPAKGSQLVARLAAYLVAHRPDVPLMVATGRAGAAGFLQAVQRCGVDTACAHNLVLMTEPLSPWQVFGWARICLMPSVVEESGGRVAVEAQCVGAVPLVSDQGALPSTVGQGGLVLPLPPALLSDPQAMISQAAAQPWIDAMLALMDDEAHWRHCSQQAKAHAEGFLAPKGVPRYDAWARACLASA